MKDFMEYRSGVYIYEIGAPECTQNFTLFMYNVLLSNFIKNLFATKKLKLNVIST